jgi:hypothetical protein
VDFIAAKIFLFHYDQLWFAPLAMTILGSGDFCFRREQWVRSRDAARAECSFHFSVVSLLTPRAKWSLRKSRVLLYGKDRVDSSMERAILVLHFLLISQGASHGMDHTAARSDRPELRNQFVRQRRAVVQ